MPNGADAPAERIDGQDAAEQAEPVQAPAQADDAPEAPEPAGDQVVTQGAGQAADVTAPAGVVDLSEATPEEADAAEAAEEDDLEDEDIRDEGEIAADYLEELLDIADFDGDIDIEVKNGRTYLSIVSEDTADEESELDILVGENGEVLNALQELARLAVLAETGERSRLILDIAGHRARQGSRLVGLVEKAVSEIRETGGPVALEPMGAYERKQIHDLVAEAGLVSESEGEGAGRHVVILAKES
ncbi:protein jag [Falsarthrobacter nasiphocae]|uniref:SpoIIIJ-associated protein n=1 Tax=Falsarthrobacter nasiphocae TaxID=189863 RepID=A0AAE3YHK6_9MICC|nr:R3H domain-containing nucleic acid-binding protein [Falsarthrobacter nasiphocae]MDR6892078.1 spoIIIJ-associated protein [Falsarthrobacter nasiphocae]